MGYLIAPFDFILRFQFLNIFLIVFQQSLLSPAEGPGGGEPSQVIRAVVGVVRAAVSDNDAGIVAVRKSVEFHAGRFQHTRLL
jgi:hypothetical protein